MGKINSPALLPGPFVQAPCCAGQCGCHGSLPLSPPLDAGQPAGWRVGPTDSAEVQGQAGPGCPSLRPLDGADPGVPILLPT